MAVRSRRVASVSARSHESAPPHELTNTTRAGDVKRETHRWAPRSDASRERDKRRFLDEFRKHKTVSMACEAIGRTRQAPYAWRRSDPEFAQAWDEIVNREVDVLEHTIMHRAVHGYERPIYQGGKLVGTEVVHHPQLAIFMLTKCRPDKFGETAVEARIAELERRLEALSQGRKTARSGGKGKNDADE